MHPVMPPPIRRDRAVLLTSLCSALCSLFLPGAAGAGPPSSPKLQSLRVEPAEVVLRGASPRQHLLVTGRTTDGRLVDLTHSCELTTSDPAVVGVTGAVVQAHRAGTARVLARSGGLTAQAVVHVRDVASQHPVHFANDVVPLLSKLGCNSGGCHGKASGQNGFKLSVFGFDSQADYEALVREGRGRRVFPAAPGASLLLTKATGTVPHGGGQRLKAGSPDYQLLRGWLEQGTPLGNDAAPHVVSLRVRPAERVLGFEAHQQIQATAVFSDGSLRDVTDAAGYASNAGHVAEVGRDGRLRTGKAPGEAAITVQYVGHVAAVLVRVPRPGAPDPFPALPGNNKIDELVCEKLKVMGLLPSPRCDDETFLRRAYLDVLGTLPTPQEARSFLADKDAGKRTKLIDQLLDRPEYADYGALRWADVLLVNRDKLGDRGAFEFHRWLRRQLALNRPYDHWVRELITAAGPSATNGPVNFYRAAATPEDAAKAVSQAFLGIRLECAQCHHHPFEAWGQEDFYGLAGFFNGLERRPAQGGGELVFHAGLRATAIPLTARLVPTRPPGGPALASGTAGDPRRELAAWMTAPANPRFARLAANRLWKHYLGRGLVEPEDDLRSTNPATNGPLLDYLAGRLVASGYDLKAVTRLILASRTYQTSSIPGSANRDDEQNYSYYRAKRLPAEVLLDAVSAATGAPESFPGRPLGTRAIELWDNRMPSYFLDVFGRSERTSPCECGRSNEPTMAQCLHLLNAPEVERKVTSQSGRVARLLAAKATEAELIDELCLATLGRPAREKERRVARRLFAQGPPAQAAQDFLWALLNSYDFLFVQ